MLFPLHFPIYKQQKLIPLLFLGIFILPLFSQTSKEKNKESIKEYIQYKEQQNPQYWLIFPSHLRIFSETEENPNSKTQFSPAVSANIFQVHKGYIMGHEHMNTKENYSSGYRIVCPVE